MTNFVKSISFDTLTLTGAPINRKRIDRARREVLGMRLMRVRTMRYANAMESPSVS